MIVLEGNILVFFHLGVDYKLEKCEEPGYLDLRQTLAEVNCLEFNLVVTEISECFILFNRSKLPGLKL